MIGKTRARTVKLEPLFVRIPRSLKNDLEKIYPMLGYKDLSELVRDILRKYIDALRSTRPDIFGELEG